MRPSKLTDANRARLEQIAQLKAQIPTVKQMSEATGLTPLYVRQLMSQMVKLIRHKHDLTNVTFHVEPFADKITR